MAAEGQICVSVSWPSEVYFKLLMGCLCHFCIPYILLSPSAAFVYVCSCVSTCLRMVKNLNIILSLPFCWLVSVLETGLFIGQGLAK